jgi:hypothetical protein
MRVLTSFKAISDYSSLPSRRTYRRFAFPLLLAELFMSCHGQTPSTLYDRRAWEWSARLTRTQRDSVGQHPESAWR